MIGRRPGPYRPGTLKIHRLVPKYEAMSARLLFACRTGGLVLPPGSAVLRLAATLLLGGASGACGFAAVGFALYGSGPLQGQAAVLFAGFGFIAGLSCGGLHAVLEGLPAQPEAPMAPEALAGLVRAALATAIAEQASGTGSAAARRPSPAEMTSTALAGAAATSMTAAAADLPTAAAVPAPLPASTAPAVPVDPVTTYPVQRVDQRRFASSEFGA